MPQKKLPAVFMRGGTSKAVIFHARDLPAEREEWDSIFLSVIGSPDPNMRQLDGMGGGISSLSKVCVIGPPTHPDADVDYTFAQVQIDKARVDYNGNCGNMSSAIGPFAVDEGLMAKPRGGEAVVRIHNTNTRKIIVSRFGMDGEEAAVAGDMAIDGVAGTGAPIRLEFIEPGGAKSGKLLPTGKAVDQLEVAGGGPVMASLIDAANPCVFVPAVAVGATATEQPAEIDSCQELKAKLEALRRAASIAMGIASDLDKAASISVPLIALVAPPTAMGVLSGRKLAAADMDIAVRMMSNGQAHRATPLTGALCLAVTARIPGSIPNEMVRRLAPGVSQIRIGHASGVIVVDAEVDQPKDGHPHARFAAVYRTARRLFDGRIHYRAAR
ncbi:MAG TPA: PrpF domain-containing protein [Hyphomicrobiaceae bacterium]|nr:PrpF domain-containing protein [Hyphomicrobiaceae bacterium]